LSLNAPSACVKKNGRKRRCLSNSYWLCAMAHIFLNNQWAL
jgi:hypothetical protein